jgi:cyclic pyranopterin phosphate synthase
MQASREPTVVQRIEGQGERVHIPLGAVCNNHCLFCMEEDRASRARAAHQLDAARVRWLLEQHVGAQEVCFTSGEPTTRRDLPEVLAAARALGFARVSLMTNGRRLAYRPYAQALVSHGLTRLYVSIHGDSASLHDGLTRNPGSFEQTMQGLRNAAELTAAGLELHTSTVLTRRNVGRQAEIYAMLRGLGVQQVVMNALQVTDWARATLELVVPRYAEVRAGFERVLLHAGDRGEAAFLVDVPLCVTEGLPDRNRGFVERHLHYEAPDCAGPLQRVDTQQLDQAFRVFGEPCNHCTYRGACPGVYRRYAQRYGWEEFGLRADGVPSAPALSSPAG